MSGARRSSRRWGLSLLVALATVGWVVPAQAAGSGPPGPNPSSPAVQAEMAEGQARARAWQAEQAAAENPARVAASRTEYTNESPAGAMLTADNVFAGWFTSPVYTGLPLAKGESVTRYIGSHEAAIATADGRRAAVLSTLPLMGHTPGGAQAPINLSLQEAGGAYEPAASAASVLLPTSASGEVTFPDQGFGVSLVGAGDQAAVLSHDRLFYGDAEGQSADTDLAFEPVQTGVDVAWVIRSPSAPDEQSLRFSLPAGGHLLLAPNAPAGQEVLIETADGHLLGTVFPPAAVDAVGVRMPTSYTLSGTDTLNVHVAFRRGAHTYPILVDPLVAAWAPGMYDAWSWFDNNPGYFNNTPENGVEDPYFTITNGPSTIGQGANLMYALWSYDSVPGAYIYEEYSNNVWAYENNSLEAGGISGPNSNFASGTWADTVPDGGSGPGGSGGPYAGRYQAADESYVDSDYCAAGSTDGSQGDCPVPAPGAIEPNNSAYTSILNLTGPIGSGSIPDAQTYGDYLYESDDVTPTISGVSTTVPTGSWQPSPNGTTIATGSVTTGLGMYDVRLLDNGSDLADLPITPSSWPAPFSEAGSFSNFGNQGENLFTVQGIDQGGNTSSPATVGAVCVDNQPPVTTETGTLSNPTGGVVAPGANTLNVGATDGTADNQPGDQQSGVQSITTTISDTTTGAVAYSNASATITGATTTACGQSDASGSQTNTINTTKWLPGQYKITVTATDNVGNATTNTETVDILGTDGAGATAIGVVDGIWTTVKSTVGPPLAGIVGTVKGAAGPVIQGVTSTLQPVVQQVTGAVQSVVGPVVQQVTTTVQPVIDQALQTVAPAVQPVIGTARTLIETARQTAAPLVEEAYDTADDVVPARASLPKKPPTATSYYVYDADDLYENNDESAFNLGYNQAYYDRYSGKNSLVILDFGGQQANGSGTISTANTSPPTTFGDAAIEAFAEVFASSYASEAREGTKLTLGVGTNNSAYDVSAAGGSKWAGVVAIVSRYVLDHPAEAKKVAIWGANDLEPGYSGPQSALQWAHAYVRATRSAYVDYGSADGCSQTSHDDASCNNSWHQSTEWSLSWGVAGIPRALTGARGAPQIYFGSGAAQWEQIALYGDIYKSGRQLFEGPLDQNTAPVDGNTTTNSSQAWDDFEQSLESHVATRQTLPYSLSIHGQ